MANIKKILNKNLNTEFAKNSLTLISGTTIAQIIAILLTPILSRLYTTEDFGVLSIYMSICSLLTVVSTFRYEMAIVLPKKDKDAINIIAISFIGSLIWSVLSLIAIFLFGKTLKAYINHPETNFFLYFIPIIVIFLGLIQILNFWSIRLKAFKNNTYSRVGYTLSNNSIALSVGLIKNGPMGLLIGYFSSQIITFFILLSKIKKEFKIQKKHISLARIKHNILKYIAFPKINLVHALVESLQENGMIFLLKDWFGNAVLGAYSFAYRLLRVPSSVISSAVSQVFLEKASKAYHDGIDIKPMLIKIYTTIFIIGLPFFIILFLFAPEIFVFIFSDNYRESGEIAKILTPWLFLNFIANTASGIPIIFNKLKTPFLFSLIDILIKASSLLIGFYFKNFKLAFILISCFGSILIIITFVWVFSIINSNQKIKHDTVSK